MGGASNIRRVAAAAVLVCAALMTFASRAADLGGSPERDPCAISPTEAALLACRRQHAATADREVTEAYESLLRSRGKADVALRRALEASQNAWGQYRDAECTLRTHDSASGTAHEVYLLDCRRELTRARLADLIRMLDLP